MAEPVRIQRKRERGWRMPEGAVYVGRPTPWGNPFAYRTDDGLAREPAALSDAPWEYEGRISTAGMRHDFYHGDGGITVCHVRYMTRAECVELYWQALTGRPTPALRFAGVHVRRSDVDARLELAGKDLVCWCPLVDSQGRRVPCHADVLLAVADGREWHP